MTIEEIKLALKCGLQVIRADNEEGLEFIGNDKEWKAYDDCLNKTL